jgi:hypothetical protein
MEISNRQQVGLALGEPLLGGGALTLRAMSSQRATWPPRAAVRQRSIALMTFIWSRLTCPALARRHAAPWSRKISATSSTGRDMIAGGYADG